MLNKEHTKQTKYFTTMNSTDFKLTKDGPYRTSEGALGLIFHVLCDFSNNESQQTFKDIVLETLMNEKAFTLHKFYTCGINSAYGPSIDESIKTECKQARDHVKTIINEYNADQETPKTLDSKIKLREKIITKYICAIKAICDTFVREGFYLVDGRMHLNGKPYVPKKLCTMADYNPFHIDL